MSMSYNYHYIFQGESKNIDNFIEALFVKNQDVFETAKNINHSIFNSNFDEKLAKEHNFNYLGKDNTISSLSVWSYITQQRINSNRLEMKFYVNCKNDTSFLKYAAACFNLNYYLSMSYEDPVEPVLIYYGNNKKGNGFEHLFQSYCLNYLKIKKDKNVILDLEKVQASYKLNFFKPVEFLLLCLYYKKEQLIIENETYAIIDLLKINNGEHIIKEIEVQKPDFESGTIQFNAFFYKEIENLNQLKKIETQFYKTLLNSSIKNKNTCNKKIKLL